MSNSKLAMSRLERMADNPRKRPLDLAPLRSFADLGALEGPIDSEPNGRFPSISAMASNPSAPLAVGRGGGSKLRAERKNREGVWSRFRQGSGGENEHPSPKEMNAPRGGVQRGGVHFFGASGSGRSAGELLERADQVFVGGVSVDRRRGDGLVAGEALGEADVACDSVQIRTRGMTKRMKAEAAVEAGPFLPPLEGMASLASREAVALAAHEEGRVLVEGLPGPALPGVELVELGADVVGEDDLLAGEVVVAALEHPQLYPPAGAAVGEYVAHVEGEELVLAQACAQGEGVDDVVAEAVFVLSGHGEQGALFMLGEGPGGAGDAVGVEGHLLSLVKGTTAYTLPIAEMAREAAIFLEGWR